MRRFILGWKRLGYAACFGAKIVNYADDLVICCQHGAKEALGKMRDLMGRIKLSVNEEKTRLCRMPEEHFDFLGYTFGRCYSMRGRGPILGRARRRRALGARSRRSAPRPSERRRGFPPRRWWRG